MLVLHLPWVIRSSMSWLHKWVRRVRTKTVVTRAQEVASPRRRLALSTSSYGSSSHRQCNFDRSSQDGNNHSVVSCRMYRRRSLFFWRVLGSHQQGPRLPICYILQNNQIALDTPPAHQSGVELWADKAVAMGFPAWTIDGSDPAAWHASVATAREFGLEGGGPTMIHVETMRGCGHAHHYDDLILVQKLERLRATSRS